MSGASRTICHMSSQKLAVHLKVLMDPRPIRADLEEAGFEIEILTEARGGIQAAVDLVSFVVEYLDETVIATLASVVANLITRARARGPVAPESVRFSAQDDTQMVVIEVHGDGNWVQVHPRPQTPDE